MDEPEVVRELKTRLQAAIGEQTNPEVDVEDHASRITDIVLNARVASLARTIEHNRLWRRKDSHQ